MRHFELFFNNVIVTLLKNHLNCLNVCLICQMNFRAKNDNIYNC